MNNQDKARVITTGRCLIAADIDKTLLEQGDEGEQHAFKMHVAPELVRAAELGTNLALLTGNSMHELTSRFLTWLVDTLVHTNRLRALERFHFFCNSGGVYAHFSMSDPSLAAITESGNVSSHAVQNLIFQDLGGKRTIRPRFVDSGYLQRTRVLDEDADLIGQILQDCTTRYLAKIKRRGAGLYKTYPEENLRGVRFDSPQVEQRRVEYGGGDGRRSAVIQLTAKPILSFRFARSPIREFGKDYRSALVADIQAALDGSGLEQYVARPGGRSSIDVTLAYLDKEYALRFLIDRLKVHGNPRRGKLLGSNTIYLGDEVIVGGGNDYPVTRIPGLLTFAVNDERELVPFLAGVVVPSAIFDGPAASSQVLARYVGIATERLAECERDLGRGRQPSLRTALDGLKEAVFMERIQRKINGLKPGENVSVVDLQTLHAFVTLLSRADPVSLRWLSILSKELDEIMTLLATYKHPVQRALGDSHEDA